MISNKLILIALLITAVITVPIASAETTNVTPATTPFIIIDPIGNHTAGEVFFINGTTNLEFLDNQDLQLIISPVGYHPRANSENIRNPDIISYSNGTTYWSFKVTAIRWYMEYYGAYAFSSSFPNIEDYQIFRVFLTDQTNSTQQFIQSETFVQTSPSNQIPNPITVTSRQETKATPSRASPVTELVLIVAFITGIIIFGNRRC